MNSYYASLLKEISELYSIGEFEKVNALVSRELELPYIPSEVQDILENYRDECRPHLSSASVQSRIPIEQLVRGSLKQKEMAVSAMMRMNLRQIEDLVQKLLLDPELSDEFKGELIEALMEQRIDDSFSIRKNGNQIIGRRKDPVYLRALDYFDDWMMSENPNLAQFCGQLLDQEALLRRPGDFHDLNAKSLAYSIASLVFQAMMDPDGFEDFRSENNLQKVEKYPLFIERRGE